MADPKVIGISEAFSMQPASFRVGKVIEHNPERVIAEIKREMLNKNGDGYEFYVGYDDKGVKLFEFLAETVNVIYF